MTTKLDSPVDPSEGLVLQYELKLSDGLSCGGAYLKLLTDTAGFDPAELTDGTPYTIMFGPDKCGATNKVNTFRLLVIAPVKLQYSIAVCWFISQGLIDVLFRTGAPHPQTQVTQDWRD